MVATYKCQQDGSWRIANYSTQNIQECNRAECEKNSGFTFLEKINGCYRFLNESKSHAEASRHCSSTFTHGKLFLADSSEKIQAVMADILLPAAVGFPLFVWIDGVSTTSTETLVTSRGPFCVQKLKDLKEYASVTWKPNNGCLALLQLRPEVNILPDCSQKLGFLCEIESFVITV
ncbi:uncharacterized protein LOC130051158 [Ostrea edulis]|uniref:uncharacterized protein LOC130051158 n=1 Tax=Ostrea edulis TaxID=37623 RepID=UPI0024AEFD19|nr:uncharacterized protein LOC130051158 [Ostrea edulis]